MLKFLSPQLFDLIHGELFDGVGELLKKKTPKNDVFLYRREVGLF